LQNLVTIESQNKLVSASLSLESIWIGNTVCPAAPVLEIFYRRGPVVKKSLLSFQPAVGGLIRCGLEFVSLRKQRPKTRFGAGRQVVVLLREKHDKERQIEITLRLTGISAFCSLRQPRKRTNTGCDVSQFNFADGSVYLNSETEIPLVAYAPSSMIFAYWTHHCEHHLVMLQSPGTLAEMQFGVLDKIAELSVQSGADGCRLIYTQLPFTKTALPPVRYGEDIRPSFKLAFETILAHFNSEDDDFWVMRGEPGIFAIAARRRGSRWLLGGITFKARTLTVRFEDLWLRMPLQMKARKWNLRVRRDPVNNEPGDLFDESFSGLDPDVRIALDLRKCGGFLMEFSPGS